MMKKAKRISGADGVRAGADGVRAGGRPTIAVVGATGLVGRTFLKVLTERAIEADYILFNREGGAELAVCGRVCTTVALTAENVRARRYDFALFSAGSAVAAEFAPIFVECGAVVIDNSSCFRRDADKELVVPEVNMGAVKNRGGIISNPNCTTIGAMVALKPLDDAFGLRSVVYSTYQAISGAGARPKFAWPIADNVIPYIDGEEAKMEFETQKILGHAVTVWATCIRVPVRNCHTITIHAEFEGMVDEAGVREALGNGRGVVMLDDGRLPMPILVDGRDEVFVGRVRARGHIVDMVICLDNIRKGAATNAVQIMQEIMYSLKAEGKK